MEARGNPFGDFPHLRRLPLPNNAGYAAPFLRASRLQYSGLPTSTLLFTGPLKTILQKVVTPRAALISEWLSAGSPTAHAG